LLDEVARRAWRRRKTATHRNTDTMNGELQLDNIRSTMRRSGGMAQRVGSQGVASEDETTNVLMIYTGTNIPNNNNKTIVILIKNTFFSILT
jgi:hypothetical protein